MGLTQLPLRVALVDILASILASLCSRLIKNYMNISLCKIPDSLNFQIQVVILGERFDQNSHHLHLQSC